MDERFRALNGFGLGARVGDRARLGDARTWLLAQLDGGAPQTSAPEVANGDNISSALAAYRNARGTEEERRAARQRIARIVVAESRAAIAQRVSTDRPFVERLAAFWSNHLCVSAGAKLPVAALAGSYEREAIRPHVLGRFEDMVLASAKHPAMLLYLDNAQSIGRESQAAQVARRRNAGRSPGLNENYARELLELHTLGVNGGYTQRDVQELARLLTGWTVRGAGPLPGGRARMDAGGIAFEFRPQLHDAGDKIVLGARYGDAGVREGARAIRALCRHPSTAKFLAAKLARHFVSDQPSAAAVSRIESVFAESGGDLKAVSAALVSLPDAWTQDARKFRTPQDWLVAVLRAFNAPDAGDAPPQLLRQLRHPLWSPAAPKGFGDGADEWADPDSLMNRAELARSITRRALGARRDVDPRVLLDVMDLAANDPLRDMLADAAIEPAERVALAVAGPAFQWR